ncbi:MAG: hypothetical protein COV35_04430 [Alphaproteobacteria bacterium CG11_big_fil_rev_8_21_14_0_20_39_49]|nr:MAG: hypothetical protein COV35_04430 [Alphaproteobacteria bacterium CG11_big_fil_rev_8_21_14_0_20_39_49]
MEIIDNRQLGTAFAFIFGLLFGSFATMASHRIPLGEELIFTPSHCPKCNHKLGIVDLLPVFSWLFNKGKCHYCRSKVHWRYPAIELVMGSLFAAFYWKSGFTTQTLSLTLMTVCIVISLVILLEKKQISNQVLGCMIPAAILYKYSVVSDIAGYLILPVFAFIIIKAVNLLAAPLKKGTIFPNEAANLVFVIFLFVNLNSYIGYLTLLSGLFFMVFFTFGKKIFTLSIYFSLFTSLLLYHLSI